MNVVRRLSRFIYFKWMVPLARNMDDGPKRLAMVRNKFGILIDGGKEDGK